MAEEIDQIGAGAPDASLDEPIGGEIRVRGGGYFCVWLLIQAQRGRGDLG